MGSGLCMLNRMSRAGALTPSFLAICSHKKTASPDHIMFKLTLVTAAPVYFRNREIIQHNILSILVQYVGPTFDHKPFFNVNQFYSFNDTSVINITKARKIIWVLGFIKFIYNNPVF